MKKLTAFLPLCDNRFLLIASDYYCLENFLKYLKLLAKSGVLSLSKTNKVWKSSPINTP